MVRHSQVVRVVTVEAVRGLMVAALPEVWQPAVMAVALSSGPDLVVVAAAQAISVAQAVMDLLAYAVLVLVVAALVIPLVALRR